MIEFRIKKLIKTFFLVVSVFVFVSPTLTEAQLNIDAKKLLPRVSVFSSPRNGSFVEGSTFEVPVLIDSRGLDINGIEVRVSFDPKRLSVVQPSGGQSIIGVWIEPPSYDNTKGTINYVGVIPNGIKTESGLIGTITFQAKSTGKAVVSINTTSNILLNDGAGTEAAIDLGRSEYNIIPKAPDGVRIYSDTHPFSSEWYSNKDLSLYWDKDPGVSGFSYVLDNKPNTVPESKVVTPDTTSSFENLSDGLWYFHIKSYKSGVWGNTGHFLVRVDTAAPAEFQPEVNYVLASSAFVERALISFFTTDNLSGISHYEVGVIDKSQPITESPVFIQTQSPFQVSSVSKEGLQVIVRAVDNAGNIRDASIEVRKPNTILKILDDYLIYILIAIIIAGFIGLLLHYLVGHHIVRNIKRAVAIIKKEEQNEHHSELDNNINNQNNNDITKNI